MAKKIEITINGEAYPCRQTMGAMLRFKRETGREITEAAEGQVSDIITLLWCCIVSTCNAEGKAFPYDLLAFADNVDVETAMAWAAAIQGEPAEDDGEKKSL